MPVRPGIAPLAGLSHLLAQPKNSLPRQGQITSDYLPFSPGAQRLPPVAPISPAPLYAARPKAGLRFILSHYEGLTPRRYEYAAPQAGSRSGSLALAGEQRCARERMLRIGNSVLRTREHRGGATRESPRKAGRSSPTAVADSSLGGRRTRKRTKPPPIPPTIPAPLYAARP